LLQNRELRRIFGPKREEVTRNWRKLHHEELHNFTSLSPTANNKTDIKTVFTQPYSIQQHTTAEGSGHTILNTYNIGTSGREKLRTQQFPATFFTSPDDG
jgi:hypothetical protein